MWGRGDGGMMVRNMRKGKERDRGERGGEGEGVVDEWNQLGE